MAAPLSLALPSGPRLRRPSVGVFCGAVFFSVWSLLLLLGATECALQATGLLRVSREYLEGRATPESGGRQLDGGLDYGWDSGDDDFDYILLDLTIRLGVFVGLLGVEGLTFIIYYFCYIKPTATLYIPKDAIIPQDLKGRWKHDRFDCAGDIGTCCCFMWCQPCTVADMWYRAGWLHIAMEGLHANIAGWQWFAGVCGWCCMANVANACFPCIMAFLRGGALGDGGLGLVVPLKQMFGMQGSFGDFIEDCCCWCWCGPCMGTQEYRQVMAVLNRGPPEVGQPAVTTVVGNVVGLAVGVPVDQAQPKEDA